MHDSFCTSQRRPPLSLQSLCAIVAFGSSPMFSALPRMLHGAELISLIGTQFVGSWLTAPARTCECFCNLTLSAAPDSGLLNVIQRQLDRCGPEHLTLPACPPCPEPASPLPLLLAVGFFGILIGLIIGQWLRPSVLSWTPRLAALPKSAAPSSPTSPSGTSSASNATPSTLRLRDGNRA